MPTEPLPGEFADVAQMWAAGGWAMYPITLVLMVGLAAALLLLVVLIVNRRAKLLPAVAGAVSGFGLLTIALGAWGRSSGLAKVQEVLPMVTPEDAELILAYGRAEAQVPWSYGLLGGVPLVLVGAAVLLLTRKRASGGSEAPAVQASP